jgi:hypothetical protein
MAMIHAACGRHRAVGKSLWFDMAFPELAAPPRRWPRAARPCREQCESRFPRRPEGLPGKVWVGRQTKNQRRKSADENALEIKMDVAPPVCRQRIPMAPGG